MSTNVQRAPESSALWEYLLAQLVPAQGESILLVGCGHVETAEAVADRVGERGEVIIVDQSEARLRSLVKLFGGEHLDNGRIELIKRDAAQSVPGYNRRFDRVLCHNIIEYSFAPWKLVNDIHRVLRPGGRMVLGQCDFSSICYEGADQALTEALVKSFCQHRQEWFGGSAGSARRLEELVDASDFGGGEHRIYTDRSEAHARVFAEAIAFIAEQRRSVPDEWVATWKRQLAAGQASASGFSVESHVVVAERAAAASR